MLKTTYSKLANFYYEKKIIKTIKKSKLFDREWYLKENPDVRASGVDPIVHYVRCGSMEGLDPCQEFSTSTYLRENPDVADSKINPLFHYILYGASEGRHIAISAQLNYSESGGGKENKIKKEQGKVEENKSEIIVKCQNKVKENKIGYSRYKIKFEIVNIMRFKGWVSQMEYATT